MSEFKNDPSGRKQIITGFVLILVAWAILALSANGARLSCEADSGQCTLLRRTPFAASQETFRWNSVREVKLVFSSTRWTASGGGARIVVEDNIVLQADREIFVLTDSDAWLFGSLSETSLSAFVGQAPPTSLWVVSFGLTPSFFWFIAAAVGALFLLMSIIRPIVPDMSAEALSAARVHNLVRFAGLSLFFALFWAASLYALLYYFVFR